MRNALRRFALAALIAPAAIGAALMIASPAEAAPKASEVSLQAEINRLVDAERTANGCAALTVNDQLTDAARNHSGWMAQTGEFSHTGKAGSDFYARATEAGYATPAAENIAWGYRSAEQVVASWMKSPGHRANILNCANTTVGVGAVYAESGTPYYTQNFGS
ncbi:CAP domain-containing protein [Actinoplanes sp. CA-015351]|uniref:CAP domain-containing protein n=1 Tax=Actinoplanes sp. CA-015351 TaxID=3239897 RepID=UPI003D993230